MLRCDDRLALTLAGCYCVTCVRGRRMARASSSICGRRGCVSMASREGAMGRCSGHGAACAWRTVRLGFLSARRLVGTVLRGERRLAPSSWAIVGAVSGSNTGRTDTGFAQSWVRGPRHAWAMSMRGGHRIARRDFARLAVGRCCSRAEVTMCIVPHVL